MSFLSDELRADKIDRLKKEIESLRVSRRILMYLVEKLEKERKNLELANQKLQKSNSRYAQTIVHKNIEIVELQATLEKRSRSTSTYDNQIERVVR